MKSAMIFPACLLSILITCLNMTSVVHGNPPLPPTESKGLKFLEEIQEAIATLVEEVKPTVVNITPVRNFVYSRDLPQPRGPSRSSAGSGIIVHEDGFIVTNNHVIGNANEAEIRFSNKTSLIAQIVGRDPDTDLALLKVSTDQKLPSIKFGDSNKVKVGQWVLAVGNPFGLDRTVTVGVVSGIGRENMNLSRYENFIQTDASINPGNSGGPLFNLRGEVIGINTAIINFAQGIGFAIPSNMANQIIMQLRSGGKVIRGWLGIGMQPLTPKLASKFGVTSGKGVLVNEVFADDPADMAGIKPGDVIISVDKDPVNTPNQLSRIIASIGPGSLTEIRVIRDKEKLTIALSLGTKQQKPTVASLPSPETTISLGLEVTSLTQELARKYKLAEVHGVLIVKVKQGSVAYTEGLREGDLIKEVNREKIYTTREFSNAIDSLQPEKSPLLRILRGSQTFFVVLKIEG